MKQQWLLLWLIPFLMGCRQETPLELALQQSGSHRGELEKVLAYFSREPSDSLELQAARFLIQNMPGHTTPQGNYIRQYRAALQDQLSLEEPFQRMLLALPAQCPDFRQKLTFSEDIQHIDPQELIRHIRTTFNQRAQLPYLQELDFNVFCEYVLPYTIAGYDLRKNWETPPDFCEEPHLLTCYYDDCRHSIAMIAENITHRLHLPAPIHLQPDSLLGNHIWTPDELEKAKWIACCLAGIPAVLDYIPCQEVPDQPACWACYLDPRLALSLPEPLQGKNIAKIFRHTYTAQSIPQPSARETIPAFFRNPFCKDVTSLYLKTAEARIVASFPVPTRYMYLAIYDQGEWSPVSFSVVEHNSGHFAHLGKNCVYLPLCCPGDTLLPLAPPFLLDSQGQSHSLVPDHRKLQSLRLDRLRPYIPPATSRYDNYKRSRYECSDDPEFRQADTVYIIPHDLYFKNETILVDTTLKKRYWRLVPPEKSNWSELSFLDARGNPLSGTWIGKDTRETTYLGDQDPDTYKTIFGWLGMDFGRAVSVAAIRHMPRSDKFNICPGHRYELQYYGEKGWLSAGIREADSFEIEFSYVPAQALYRLRDLTQNLNGHIFTWENGKYIFW